MRIIKFRAKAAAGEWVYGDLHLNTPIPHIHDEKMSKRPIQTETIGQFTSLYDKNRKEIYEGDILFPGYISGAKGLFELLEVRFVRGVFAFLWEGNLDMECPTTAPTHEWAEVIGNIYDNPGLMNPKTKNLERKKFIEKWNK